MCLLTARLFYLCLGARLLFFERAFIFFVERGFNFVVESVFYVCVERASIFCRARVYLFVLNAHLFVCFGTHVCCSTRVFVVERAFFFVCI